MTGSSVLAWMKVLGVLVVIAFVAWIVYKVKTTGTAALQAAKEIVSDTVENLNPTNYNNIVKTTVDDALSKELGYSENLGGWLYSITHRDPVEEIMQNKLEGNPWPATDYTNSP